MSPRLFRVVLPVTSVEAAAKFYQQVLGLSGKRVSSGRHYFRCGPTILACYSSREDGDSFDVPPNAEHVYFAVDDLEAVHDRCRAADCKRVDEEIKTRPWGERSFYGEDPFGNKICFVDDTTCFTAE
jgi:catechol 2,3-dioxygenase-like lactoylglutathione lyase family enzyme